MSNKEEFKKFVKENPRLVKFVNNGDMSWQKFYEMYDLYGNDENVWEEYLSKSEEKKSTVSPTTGLGGFGDILNFVKNIDLNAVQNSVGSIQRVLGVLQDFNTKDEPTKEPYKPRPIYKHFED